MTIEMQVVFEYGIIGEVLPNQFSTSNSHWQENSTSYAHFSLKYGLSPICKIIKEEPYMPEKTIAFIEAKTVGSIYSITNTFP